MDWQRYRFKTREEFNAHQREYRRKNKEIIRRIETKPKRFFDRTRLTAINRRGIEFKLDFDYFMQFWQKPCTYCGDEMPYIGLDRIDSELGYIEGNICSCCGTCNKMKQRMTVEDFLSRCKKIINNCT